MTVHDLRTNEFSPYYQTYIDKTRGLNLNDGLRLNFDNVMAFLKEIPEDKYDYRYADGKWTIKEVIQHLIDTERIFAYRALRIARGDKTLLSGFDQDAYVPFSKANGRYFDSLLSEYKSVRDSTISLFDTFDHEMLLATGTASNNTISVRALGFIIIGHENHHSEVIRERYL